MKHLNLFFTIIFLMLSPKIFSQKQLLSKEDILNNAKIFYINQDVFFYTKEENINFLNDTINSEILSSKGFEEQIVFIKIKFRGNFQAFRKDTIPEFKYTENKVPFSCEYIIGMDTKNKAFYKLKGFETNDFLLLFNKKYRKKDKADFLEKFWVSELDLDCLFDNFFCKEKDNKQSICLICCNERDKRFAKGTAD